jgi:hypothetical protein
MFFKCLFKYRIEIFAISVTTIDDDNILFIKSGIFAVMNLICCSIIVVDAMSAIESTNCTVTSDLVKIFEPPTLFFASALQ